MLSSPIEMAHRLLSWAGLSVPVDPFALSNLLGVTVEFAPLRGVDGLLRRDRHGDWYVILSSRVALTRQRFTLAHELGHFLMHRRRREVWALRPGERTHYERQANRFAAALLMPEASLLQLTLDFGPDAGRLAAACGVSRQAMAIRLQQLGLAEPAPIESWIDF